MSLNQQAAPQRHSWPLLCILLSVVFTQSLLADHMIAQPVEPKRSSSKAQPTLEAKAGYFFFTSSKMRKVYNEGGWDVQVSSTYPIWKWLHAYASVEFSERHGRPLHSHNKTWIRQLPLSLGLRPVIKLCPKVQYYITLGPRYSFVHVDNNASNVSKNLNHSGLGGFVNTGFNFLPWGHLLLDVFGEYSYNKMRFHSSKPNVYFRRTQVGGLTFGVGLGYAF